RPAAHPFPTRRSSDLMKPGKGKATVDAKSSVALLLIDVVNDFNFPEAGQLIRHAVPMARNIAALKRRCNKAGIPSIYVNDNFSLDRKSTRLNSSHVKI